MSIFRRNIIFRAEMAADPDEPRWRFRRRMVVLAVFVAIFFLGIPVFRERMPAGRAAKAARIFAQDLMDSRLLVAQSRKAVMLHLDKRSKQFWEREASVKLDCTSMGHGALVEHLGTTGVVWRALLDGKDIEQLCYHPFDGLLVDSQPLKGRSLFILVGPEEDLRLNRTDRIHYITVKNYGSDIGLGLDR